MNTEQAKKSVRWFITTFGGVLAGYFAAWSGWFSADQIVGAMNSPMFIAMASSLAMLVWSWISGTPTSVAAIVAEMAKDPNSPIKGLITENTVEGRQIANNTPGAVVAAGTPEATAIAKQGA